MRVFQKGKKKIYRDLNVYHLIKRLNQLENITFFQNKTSKLQYWLNKHAKQNVIDCDIDSNSDNLSSDEILDARREQVEMWFKKH